MILPIDLRYGGKGLGLGKPAEVDDLCDIGYRTRFYGGLLYPILSAGANLDELLIPNTYASINSSTNTYVGIPSGLYGTFTLEVMSAGAEGQIMQRITICSKTNPLEYVRFYYQKSWGEWIRKFGVSLYDKAYSNGGGTITLSESCVNFAAIDIHFTDNNGVSGGMVRVYSPNGKTVVLSSTEASSGASTYIRRTKYMISATAITPDVETAGYIKVTNNTVATTSGTNFLRITKVLAYHGSVL